MKSQPLTSIVSASESLGVLVGQVRAQLLQALEADMAAHAIPLRFVQFLTIKTLAIQGPLSAGDLARAVDLDGGAMTRHLDHLEELGYLRRCAHAQDRRALSIVLTPAGAVVWAQLNQCHQRVLEMAQNTLSSSERAHLTDYLTRVLHALRVAP
jgi:DNA-binding MarR family transcriptional regulator